MKIQKAYQKTKRPTIDCGPGLTEQAHKKECDINHILRDYTRTGLIKHAKQFEGRYDDIQVQDFQDAMFIVANANNMFNQLPGETRKQFGNSPAAFLDFVNNPANKGRMAEMGILRGNDGLDINGAAVGSPTPSEAPPTSSAEDKPAS